jgi:hypothetical protein
LPESGGVVNELLNLFFRFGAAFVMRKTEMFKEFVSGRQPFFSLFSIFSQLFGLERTAVVRRGSRFRLFAV